MRQGSGYLYLSTGGNCGECGVIDKSTSDMLSDGSPAALESSSEDMRSQPGQHGIACLHCLMR